MDPEIVSGILILLSLCGIPLALPLIFGVLIFKSFWNDEISRLAGFFTLKPVIVFPLFVFIWQDHVLETALPLFISLLFTVMIAYYFRRLLRKHILARYFLLGNLIGWLIAFIFWLFWDGIGVILAELFLPTIYATVSLIFAYGRSERMKRSQS